MTRAMVLLFVLVDFLAVLVAAEFTAVVDTRNGPVRGEIRTSVNSIKYAAFKGIPYAKPPLHDLRFKPPVALEPWTETLNATTEGEDCIQFDAPSMSVKGSENCLFINVYTPTTNLGRGHKRGNIKSNKSVMVFLHGGGFASGTSSPKLYNPEYLLEKDVVYVSLNYRLGPLGFLSLGHENATGNAGLKDQVFGLKWVKANIKQFGGNPNNVTVFGQSAGAISIGFHLISDASAGLFHAAISMSGVPLNPRSVETPERAISQAVKLGALIGTNSTDKEILLQAFYRAPAVELVRQSIKLAALYPAFAPTIEDPSIATDVFMSKCSIDKYNAGNFLQVPHMLGFMDQEAAFYAGSLASVKLVVVAASDALGKYGMKLPDKLAQVKNLIETSPDPWAEISKDQLEAVVNITTDVIFKAQIDRTQRIYASTKNAKPIYYYHISFNTNRSLHNILFNNPYQGAGHADDIAYLFYFPGLGYSTDPSDPTRRTINRVSTMWTNFAKYGNPTPHWARDENVDVTWPNSGLGGLNLNIGAQLTVEPRPINAFTRNVQKRSWPHLGKINGCC